MANLQKITYATGDTITAANLNSIQENIEKYCVPNYSTSNNGQILMIVGGQMVWMTIPTAETTSF